MKIGSRLSIPVRSAQTLGVDPADLERIALLRLPELQTASGLFRGGDPERDLPSGDPSSIRASAVVLIGLARADEFSVDHGFSLGSLRTGLLNSIGLAGVSVGELGLALWAEAAVDGGATAEVFAEIQRRLPLDASRLPLEELAWLVSGMSEAGTDSALLEEMARELEERAQRSGLFSDSHRKVGGGLGTVGSQLHALVALSKAGESGAGQPAPEVRARVARSLIELQRPDGGWPGVIDSRKGEAAEVYPIFTVNQLALAPMAFRSVPVDSDEAVKRGIEWALGANALGFDLVHPKEARIDHGISPRRHAGSVIRGVGKAARLIRREPRDLDPEDLILDPHVSAEDLGWLLEAWVGR